MISQNRLRRPRLAMVDTIRLSEALKERRDEVKTKSPYRIAKLFKQELGINVTPSNVTAVAKAAQVEIGVRTEKRRRKVDNKLIASLLERICVEVGMSEDNPLFDDIRKLSEMK